MEEKFEEKKNKKNQINPLAGVFSITGEKLVNPEGYTLNKTEL